MPDESQDNLNFSLGSRYESKSETLFFSIWVAKLKECEIMINGGKHLHQALGENRFAAGDETKEQKEAESRNDERILMMLYDP